MKVLIAIDESECSSAAVDRVIEECWPKDAEFLVLNVVEPFYLQYATPQGGYIGNVVEAQQALEKYMEKFVSDTVKKLRLIFGHDRVAGSVITGPPAVSIIDIANEWNADLIVLGSHGKRGFRKFLLGSVAENVARHARCSVEIVKQAKDNQSVKPAA